MRGLLIFAALSGNCLLATGCRGSVQLDRDDKAILEQLAPYQPVHKADNNGYVSELKLEGSTVTDEALEHVKRLIDLRSLSLFGSSVTDTGLEKLQVLEKLDSLGLGGTSITDAGLPALKQFKALRHVWLSEQNFSPQAIEELKKAKPNLTIHMQ